MKEYNFKINGNDYTVGIEILNDTEADVILRWRPFPLRIPCSLRPFRLRSLPRRLLRLRASRP